MADELRIALAQMNAAVGDIEGNAAKVEELAARGRDAGAQLVVFPELTLTGYPP
jgi:predicted amidohydrolase